jgi:hypothetical protein
VSGVDVGGGHEAPSRATTCRVARRRC